MATMRGKSMPTTRGHGENGNHLQQRPSFDYKPTILRTLSLASIFILTTVLIGIIELAVVKLPHGNHSIFARGTSPSKRSDLFGLAVREAAIESNSSSIITSNSASGASFASTTTDVDTGSSTSTTIDVGKAPTSNYVATETTQTVSLSSTTQEAVTSVVKTSNYVATATTQTISQNGGNNNDAVGATTSSLLIASSVEKSNYVSTDATQTVTTSTAAPTMAYSTGSGQYVAGATTQTVSQTNQQGYTRTPSPTAQTLTTISSATVLTVPVSRASATVVSSYTTTDSNGNTVSTEATSFYPASRYTLITSSVPVVQAIVPGQTILTSISGGSTSVIVTGASTYSSVYGASTSLLISGNYTSTRVFGGSTSVFTSGGTTQTTILGGHTVLSTQLPQATGDADKDAQSDSNYSKGYFTIPHHWNPVQVFLGTYLAVIIAVGYRMIWTVIYNNFSLIEPFRQLNEPNGALAERALFRFYHSQSSLLEPSAALLKGRWTMALAAVTYLLASLLPALGSEAIYVDTNWGCQYPTAGMNPCSARMTGNVAVLRALQGLLAFAALALLLIMVALLRSKTGLPANPSSIATVGTLSRNPDFVDDITTLPCSASTRDMRESLQGRRYKLDFYKSGPGELAYGIVPMAVSGGDDVYAAGEHTYKPVSASSKSHRYRILDFVLLLVTLGTLAMVLAYYVDAADDPFNRFFSSNGFGPRFILTGAVTVLAAIWKSVEQSEVIMSPYTRMAQHSSGPRSTVLFTPHDTPILSTISAIFNRYYFVAVVTCITLLGEALNIVIGGVPYATGQTWPQFLASAYISIGVLALMTIVSIMVILNRRREPKIPRHPDTVGAVVSYLAGSRFVDDFDGLEWQDEDTRDRRIRLLAKRYVFDDRPGSDGRRAWLVDEVYE
ncbi:hypothetical protein LTR78_004345 [Recurvomyces mirabilis]|uniref:Uncharacterized protein n=1 Tax=Recurvomyces mirabilis TaxID=574656 RepID=A0AAE0WPY8_9PEZI|nr:hypothetical protein LTR78_004345 [Recurvomyces mirabilis]KAK5155989.1 hypothetical protein LTS14_005555 [Recurvomyces mirabilis]